MRTTLRFWYGFVELCIAQESPNPTVLYKWVSSQVAAELYACMAGHVILLVKLTCFIKSSVCAWLYRLSSQCDQPLFQHTIYYLSNHYIRLLLWTTIVLNNSRVSDHTRSKDSKTRQSTASPLTKRLEVARSHFRFSPSERLSLYEESVFFMPSSILDFIHSAERRGESGSDRPRSGVESGILFSIRSQSLVFCGYLFPNICL